MYPVRTQNIGLGTLCSPLRAPYPPAIGNIHRPNHRPETKRSVFRNGIRPLVCVPSYLLELPKRRVPHTLATLVQEHDVTRMTVHERLVLLHRASYIAKVCCSIVVVIRKASRRQGRATTQNHYGLRRSDIQGIRTLAPIPAHWGSPSC